MNRLCTFLTFVIEYVLFKLASSFDQFISNLNSNSVQIMQGNMENEMIFKRNPFYLKTQFVPQSKQSSF